MDFIRQKFENKWRKVIRMVNMKQRDVKPVHRAGFLAKSEGFWAISQTGFKGFPWNLVFLRFRPKASWNAKSENRGTKSGGLLPRGQKRELAAWDGVPRDQQSRDFWHETFKLRQVVEHWTDYTSQEFQAKWSKHLEMATIKQSHLKRWGMCQNDYHNYMS